MSEMAKAARAAMKSKIRRLTSGEPKAKVDASTWSPPEMMNTEAKTGLHATNFETRDAVQIGLRPYVADEDADEGFLADPVVAFTARVEPERTARLARCAGGHGLRRHVQAFQPTKSLEVAEACGS